VLRAPGGDAPAARGRRGSRPWAYAATGWSVLFAALHLYWALGGTVGLVESSGSRLAADRPTWFVVVGLYGVALVLLAAAALGVALARGPLTGRARRFLPLLAAGVAAVLLVRSVGVEVLLLTDAGYGQGAISPAQRWWSLALWNPWFLMGAVAFGVAAIATRHSAESD
jgi:hypothetical protein